MIDRVSGVSDAQASRIAHTLVATAGPPVDDAQRHRNPEPLIAEIKRMLVSSDLREVLVP